jgi:uncharacterized protein (TIGR02145 family)
MEKSRILIFVVIFISFILTSNNIFSQVTDKDGNTYTTVLIDKLEFTVENLNVEHYRNGDAIPQVKNAQDWEKLTTGAWCYYENKTENGKVYGKLYNWYAVNDPRGLAPEGWRLPNMTEIKNLTGFLGWSSVAGGKMKATTLWESPNKSATNESGFTALPGGMRDKFGFCSYKTTNGYFWTSDFVGEESAKFYSMDFDYEGVHMDSFDNRYGLSVRIVKDN